MAGRVGRKRELGRGWKRKEGEVRWAAGLGWAGGGLARLDRFCFFFFFFFSFFQIHFKPIFQTFLNQIFTQISPTIFKGFSQTIFNNFSNIFKPLHKFSQTFSQLF
jgi:hypothetical protein